MASTSPKRAAETQPQGSSPKARKTEAESSLVVFTGADTCDDPQGRVKIVTLESLPAQLRKGIEDEIRENEGIVTIRLTSEDGIIGTCWYDNYDEDEQEEAFDNDLKKVFNEIPSQKNGRVVALFYYLLVV